MHNFKQITMLDSLVSLKKLKYVYLARTHKNNKNTNKVNHTDKKEMDPELNPSSLIYTLFLL